MLKNLETGLAEREAMIRILQSNKTMSNSNLAAEIVNKAASGVVVGAPATSGISDTNSVDATSALRSMLLQTPSSLHTSGSHNLPQHQYQMSLVGSTTPSSSATSILHNKSTLLSPWVLLGCAYRDLHLLMACFKIHIRDLHFT